MILTDTILALSSPPPISSLSARAILRLSGSDAFALAAKILPLPDNPKIGHHPALAISLLHPTLPCASALLFKSPHSFTGQDIAELHLPNSPALLRAITDHLLQLAPEKLRSANPGEFSARAFFNGKIDLTQAEGIAATIHATNHTQLRAAASLREGALHRRTADLAEQIAGLLADIEAGIDFSDESGVSFISLDAAEKNIAQLRDDVHHLLASAVRLDRLDTLPTVVLIGKPNVGKSSLINALTGDARSITSDIAGTTRDMLAALLHTPAGDIRILDVPGEEPATDGMRQKMMDARAQALLQADLIIHIIDDALEPHIAPGLLGVIIQTKSDLSRAIHPAASLAVSAKTGHSIPQLRSLLEDAVRDKPIGATEEIALNHRHRALLTEVESQLHAAAQYTQDPATFKHHPELLAADLRRALDLLGQITGTISPDEILGRIFSTFCIGK